MEVLAHKRNMIAGCTNTLNVISIFPEKDFGKTSVVSYMQINSYEFWSIKCESELENRNNALQRVKLRDEDVVFIDTPLLISELKEIEKRLKSEDIIETKEYTAFSKRTYDLLPDNFFTL